MDKKCMVQIQIANYKRLDMLKVCIDSIFYNCDGSIPYRLVVINDCPGDKESIDWLNTEFKDLCNSNKVEGESISNEINLREPGSHNIGIRLAVRDKIPYVQHLSNDTKILNSNWLKEVVKTFLEFPDYGPDSYRVAMVAPEYANMKWGDTYEVRGYKFTSMVESWAACFRTEIFEKIGLWNEEFIVCCGDIDMAYRLEKFDWKVGLIPNYVQHVCKGQRDLLGDEYVSEKSKKDFELLNRLWGGKI